MSMIQGEEAIKNFLIENNFMQVKNNQDLKKAEKVSRKKWFIHSYQPRWLQKLHLDFLIKYEDIFIGVEYDGRQHFSCDRHFYHDNYAAYECSRERDRRKDMICSIYRCPLIRLEDIGDVVSTSPLTAKYIIQKALTKGISRALYLQKHSHIYGVIKEPISWYNAYYSYSYKKTVINECSQNAKNLNKISNILYNNINKLMHSEYSKGVNYDISDNINMITLLVKSTVNKLGVLKPKLQRSLNCIENDILMGLLQFYTRPSIGSMSYHAQDYFFSSQNHKPRKYKINNIQDEKLTCKMIKQFAKQTLDDVKIVRISNLNN